MNTPNTQDSTVVSGKIVSQALSACHITPEKSNFTFTVTMKRKPSGEIEATHRMVAYMYREDGHTVGVQAKCQTVLTLDQIAANYIPLKLIESLLRKQIKKQERKRSK